MLVVGWCAWFSELKQSTPIKKKKKKKSELKQSTFDISNAHAEIVYRVLYMDCFTLLDATLGQ